MAETFGIDSLDLKVRRTVPHLPEEEQAHANEVLADWVQAEGVRPYGGRNPCLLKVSNPKHKCHPKGRCDGYVGFSVLDHMEWWRDFTGGFVLTAHPYALGTLAALFRWADANGISAEVYHPRRSWYWPGETFLIVLQGKQ
jgi:hypothetical protein